MTEYLETFSGRRFAPLAPDTADIDLYDIAHGLSLKCRWNGACSAFYSIAQHSAHVHDIAEAMAVNRADLRQRRTDWLRNFTLAALLHDGHEIYLGDCPRPLKGALAGYAAIEALAQRAVFQRFEIDWDLQTETLVRWADDVACLMEARSLMRSRAEGWQLATHIGEFPRWVPPLPDPDPPALALDAFWNRLAIYGLGTA